LCSATDPTVRWAPFPLVFPRAAGLGLGATSANLCRSRAPCPTSGSWKLLETGLEEDVVHWDYADSCLPRQVAEPDSLGAGRDD
jgi:hypothetical protein